MGLDGRRAIGERIAHGKLTRDMPPENGAGVSESGWARRLLAALVPPVLILSSVRLLLTPAFLEWEYRSPGFPADPYGFSTEDRLRWAPFALAHLFEAQPSSFLAGLEFEDGSPAFNEREVRHMEDVRRLTQAALKVWAVAWVAAGGASTWIAAQSGWASLAGPLRAGARATLILTVGLGLLVALGFPLFFLGFHRIFFQGDTWLFAYTDTLIRLFPIRFWRDASIAFAVLTLGSSGTLYLVTSAARRTSPSHPSP